MIRNKKLTNFYKHKKILITGHTGFVGSWLCIFLKNFNCKIYGISKNNLENSKNYKLLKISSFLENEFFLDINNYKKLDEKIKIINPHIIFHLAAQSYVLEGYKNPIDTFKTNIIGTANILKSLISHKIKHSIIITSDKCYANSNRNQYFSEGSILGGNDPYSASKACAELITKSFTHSYKKEIYIHTIRAGNILGGGDFGKQRLIPDIYFSRINNKKLYLRYPKAIRPWQNILDVIHAYSLIPLHQSLIKKRYDSWNLGPNICEKKINVQNLVKKFLKHFNNNKDFKIIINKRKQIESEVLMLNSNKIRKEVKWKDIYTIDETLMQIAEWYNIYHTNKSKIKKFSDKLLKDFLAKI